MSAALAALLVLLAPAAASAQSCVVDPDVSATVQYCEVLPTAESGGPAAPGAEPQTLEDVLSPEDVARLEDLGPLGEALLKLPAESGLPRQAGAALRDLGDLLGGRLGRSGAPGVPQAVLDALRGSGAGGGIGGGVLAVIAVATFGALGLTALRLRSSA